MIEAVFPVLGAAFVVLVVLPLCSLTAKGTLLLLERSSPLGASSMRFLVLAAPSLLPLAWFLSAALHQLESGKSALACLLDHAGAAHCLEPGAFALSLCLWFVYAAMPVIRNHRGAPTAIEGEATPLFARVGRLIAADAALAPLRDRVVVTAAPDFTIGTVGWSKPRVFIGAAFAARLSDDMLASALGHELQHVRCLDPLRYLVVEVAQAANPFGRFLLRPHAARWCAAHEAHCDREAVASGSLPLALAEAIVQAARPSVPVGAPLGTGDAAVVRLRIGMLFAFAERAPVGRHRATKHTAFSVACALLALAVALPHQAGTGALDALHTTTELALTHFLL